jgi:hypothetical protein
MSSDDELLGWIEDWEPGGGAEREAFSKADDYANELGYGFTYFSLVWALDTIHSLGDPGIARAFALKVLELADAEARG